MSKHCNAGTVEFYRERHAVETALTLGVLRALPPDMLAYKPHEQSASAEAIFGTMVRGLITRNEVAAIICARWEARCHRYTENRAMQRQVE
jgi:hypothetical protein